MDAERFRSVLTPAGQRLLRIAQAELHEGGDTLALGSRLRREHSPDLVAAVLTQATLRLRAERKFGAAAAEMYFTSEGLQQATRARVAAHHAERFGQLGQTPDRVSLDLCCGIGADLVALAVSGWTVHGVDRDQLTVDVARANTEALGVSSRACVSCADVTAAEPDRYDAAFCDPSRRTGAGRVFDPARYSPPLTEVFRLARRAPAAGVKIAPGVAHAMIPPDAETEWVSDGGEVKEAALWFGALGHAGTRRATLLPSGATMTASEPDSAGNPSDPGDPRRPPVTGVRRYLYEPDGAVIRAGLVAEIADLAGGALLDPSIAYVTSDSQIRTPFARGYEVAEVLPFSLKRLRAVLAARDVGNVTLKKRGSPVDLERLRGQLRLTGDRSAVVVLTRLAGKQHALVCQPVPG